MAEPALADRPPRAANEADIRVGRRVRALRLERGLSLAEVAARAGVSIGALSQIERGLSSLRVRVMWPLAVALDADPSALVTDDDGQLSDLYCVRANLRRSLPVHSEGISKQLLSPPGAVLTGIAVVVEPGGGTAESYTHPGHEFGIVSEGELEITIDGALYRLKAGDSFAFKSTLPHSFRNAGAKRCVILWVNMAKPAEALGGS